MRWNILKELDQESVETSVAWAPHGMSQNPRQAQSAAYRMSGLWVEHPLRAPVPGLELWGRYEAQLTRPYTMDTALRRLANQNNRQRSLRVVRYS